jgi:rhodanese-related sulfurtransferase
MVAAVIGKIDAMVFVLGLMIGIFIFGSFYEDFAPLYTGENLGSIFIFDTLGLQRDWFVFLLVLVALAAFIITRKIEDKVNGLEPGKGLFTPLYTGPVLIMLVAAVVVLWLPESPRAKWFETNAETVLQEAADGNQFVMTEELAYKLLNPKENNYLLVDVRGDKAFAEFTLPGSVHIPADKVLDLGYNKLLSESKKPILFFGFSDTEASRAWMSLRRAGLTDVFVLKGGLNQFFETIFFAETQTNTIQEMPVFEARFIERAREAFQSGEAAEKINVKAKPVTTIVEMEAPPAGQGGC